MALAPIAQISTTYEQYPNYWLKGYAQGTTTPISMATDGSGDTLLAKAEISGGGTVPIGFIKTTGDAIFIPYYDEAYDLYLFPTEAEADANDTSNAIQVADNMAFLIDFDAFVGIASYRDTVALMVADTDFILGDTVVTGGYQTSNDGGSNTYEVVVAGTGTTDNGQYIDLPNTTPPLQAKGLFPEGIINVNQFGASTAISTTAVQAAIDFIGDNGGGTLDFVEGQSYTLGSVKVPDQTIVQGNNCLILPDSNPDECFLVETADGDRRDNISILNFRFEGDVTDFIKVTGSYWWSFKAENIWSESGTGNSLVKTEIVLGVNPSGFRLVNLNAIHAGRTYGWHGSGSDVGASIDHVHVDHVEMWPAVNGFPVRVGHSLSMNSWVTKLYHGASSGVGGGGLHVESMNGGKVGEIWLEANGNTSALSGSFRDVNVEYLFTSTHTATEVSTTRLLGGHFFNVVIEKMVFFDEDSAGYERDDSPPANYKCFQFVDDSAGHISRDVRMHNEKGNFNHGHIINATGQGIRYTGKPGDDYIFADHTGMTFTSATPGIGTANTVSIGEFSNWEWGIEGEAIEVIISGNVIGTNAKDVRFSLADVNVKLGDLTVAAEGAFTIRAICKPHNDGANRIRVQGDTFFDNAVTQQDTNASNTWVRDDTRTSNLYIYAPTLNAADFINVHEVVVRQLRSTVR